MTISLDERRTLYFYEKSVWVGDGGKNKPPESFPGDLFG